MGADPSDPPWAVRAADQAPTVQRSRARSTERVRQIVEAARRLVVVKGADFTIQELVKEAGMAIQTFYKHFPGKDQVVLTLIEENVAATVQQLEEGANGLSDPVARLRYYVRSVLANLAIDSGDHAMGRFIATEHWRLMQVHPEEVARVSRPYADLVARELSVAMASGQLSAEQDPQTSAWLAAQMILAVYHHYAFTRSDTDFEVIADQVWGFCVASWQGARPV